MATSSSCAQSSRGGLRSALDNARVGRPTSSERYSAMSPVMLRSSCASCFSLSCASGLAICSHMEHASAGMRAGGSLQTAAGSMPGGRPSKTRRQRIPVRVMADLVAADRVCKRG